MTIKIYRDFEQGSDEWLAARNGMLTASAVKKILTAKKLEPSKAAGVVEYCDDLIAQQIVGECEDSFQSFAMLRGIEEEHIARDYYSENYTRVEEVGFITNDKLGFPIGYSPDGLVGEKGSIEVKRRLRKFAIKSVIDGVVDPEFIIQCQTGLFVSEREWMDFICYSDGMFLSVIRVHPCETTFTAIELAARAFNEMLVQRKESYLSKGKEFELVQTEVLAYDDDEVEVEV